MMIFKRFPRKFWLSIAFSDPIYGEWIHQNTFYLYRASKQDHMIFWPKLKPMISTNPSFLNSRLNNNFMKTRWCKLKTMTLGYIFIEMIQSSSHAPGKLYDCTPAPPPVFDKNMTPRNWPRSLTTGQPVFGPTACAKRKQGTLGPHCFDWPNLHPKLR